MLSALKQLTLLKGVGGDPILAAFADGTDGFYFDFSKTDRLFQGTTGILADDGGENIYLGLEGHTWGGKTLAELVASQPELQGVLADTTGWTAVNDATVSAVGGNLRVLGNGATINPRAWKNYTVSSGALVRFEVPYVRSAGNTVTLTVNPAGGSGSVVLASASAVSGTLVGYYRATGTMISIDLVGASAFSDFAFGPISVKEIPGNHGLQATGAAQPKWQTGGLARFDGVDDDLLTTLTPSAAFTIGLKIKSVANSGTVAIGSIAGANTRCFVSVETNFAAGIGSQAGSIIKGTTNVNNITFVGFLTYDGSTVKLYVNGVEEYSGAQAGTPNTTIPLPIGAYNNNGSLTAFRAGDIYHALAIKKALTAAQILAITNLWGTT